MSVFRAFVRRRLEAAQPSWAGEWDSAFRDDGTGLVWSYPGLVEGELLSGLPRPHGSASEGDREIAAPPPIVDPGGPGRSARSWACSKIRGAR